MGKSCPRRDCVFRPVSEEKTAILSGIRSQTIANFIQNGYGISKMGDDDRTADNQTHVESFEDLLICESDLDAALKMISHTVIASEDERGDQTQ